MTKGIHSSIIITMKICTQCKTDLELSDFNKRMKSIDGLQPKCKLCEKQNYFEKKDIYKERSLKYREKNRDKVLAKKAEYRKANKELISEKRKDYYEANKQRELDNRAEYQKTFPDKCNAVTAKRKAIKLKATPSWANLKNIEQFYKQAQDTTSTTGVDHQVHHVIPLVSKLVCGLHCESNLSVITATENIKIGNRYWPNMW